MLFFYLLLLPGIMVGMSLLAKLWCPKSFITPLVGDSSSFIIYIFACIIHKKITCTTYLPYASLYFIFPMVIYHHGLSTYQKNKNKNYHPLSLEYLSWTWLNMLKAWLRFFLIVTILVEVLLVNISYLSSFCCLE